MQLNFYLFIVKNLLIALGFYGVSMKASKKKLNAKYNLRYVLCSVL